MFMFHHSPRQVEITKDFVSSYKFALDEDIDFAELTENELIFVKRGSQSTFFKFSADYTKKVFEALL